MLTDELLQRYIRRRGPFVYHLTDAENIGSILAGGLIPGAGESQFDPHLIRPGHIYLCNRVTATRSLGGHFDCSWGDAAFQVDIRMLEVIRFNADEEYWRGYEFSHGHVVAPDWKSVKNAFPKMDEPEQVYSCLIDFGSIAYRGAIPRESLRLLRVTRRGFRLGRPRATCEPRPLFGPG